jgi:hypothetical protein
MKKQFSIPWLAFAATVGLFPLAAAAQQDPGNDSHARSEAQRGARAPGVATQAGQASAQQIIVRAPPPRHIPYEARPVMPAPGHVWISGYWGWQGNNYVWVPGHWSAPPQPGLTWTQPRWGRWHRGWRYHPGYWR